MTTMSPAIGLALRRIFDDASQFPPGNLNLTDAIANHERWRHSTWEPLVGRLLTPAARFAELCDAVGRDRDWSIGVTVPADAPAVSAAEAAAALVPTSARVTAVEVPAAAPAELLDAWTAAFPKAALFLEGSADDVPAIAARRGRAKIRCGGVTADAVPPPEAVAAFIRACADRRVPFKATAGLHQPLRHHDDDLGCDVHGFLNILLATARALGGAGEDDVRETLLVTELAGLRMDCDLGAARQLFAGFGTCSIQEPIDALLDLGVLHG